ncbi:hypothetical protein [Acidovorax sp. sic0104]|uniref:hypothetical protein n=1 Tax=Acidovorax sp. sic0104 TaxID=2854784 RepID=UPI001C445AC8|nr:hypothetical protein [Acidovorax sp. sic0104]MBV7542171.1 hypothetical protein [Acidovorax sp. sic0104]
MHSYNHAFFWRVDISKASPFMGEAVSIEWATCCLNVNTNNAKVRIQPVADPVLRIDSAFDVLNTTLDTCGHLDGASAQLATARLRLEIVRALHDAARTATAEATLQDLIPEIQGFDLQTFNGWTGAACSLLDGKSRGTALWDPIFDGYLLLEDGYLVALPASAARAGQAKIVCGSLEDAHQVDLSSWDDARGTWDGCLSPSLGRDVLLNPKLVQLDLVPAD